MASIRADLEAGTVSQAGIKMNRLTGVTPVKRSRKFIGKHSERQSPIQTFSKVFGGFWRSHGFDSGRTGKVAGLEGFPGRP